MSSVSCGIVGLPNVGKSTLFNALLKKQQALAANYPFATIEPNIGIVPVSDSRLDVLAKITAEEIALALPRNDELKLPPIKPATVEFIDIAGLVKGAAEGAGLGNKFLSHIREVSVICHVVRAFEDPDVIREGSSDVKSDYETITTELIIADLGTISKIKNQKSKVQIKGQKEAAEKMFELLNKSVAARNATLNDDEREAAKQFFLLTQKPEIIVLNVSEEQYTKDNIPSVIEKYAKALGLPEDLFVVICAKIESELAGLSDEDGKEYLQDLELEESGLERLIQKAYEQLGLISFLTAGEKEVRAWTLRRGFTALRASGEIHTDFMKRFIKAEVVGYSDFVENNGWKGSREKGKARFEGKDYIVQDGDVIEFKIGS